VIFAGDAADRGATGSSKALKLVRGMLELGVGEVELALTGIVGRDGDPLVVMRLSLQTKTAGRWRERLEQDPSLATPSRRIGGKQTYRLTDGGGASAMGIGDVFEVAFVDDDLVIGNDTSAMREVLEPRVETSALATRRVLSADPQFQELRRRMNAPVGSLLAYGDWRRLGSRLRSHVAGASVQLLESSGLGAASAVMMTISPSADDDFAATLLLDFGEGGADRDIDGWFAATEPVAARKLLRELPRGGLGGMVLSVDLKAVAAASPRSSFLVWDLRGAFSDYGLDFERNVLDRLGDRGTAQLHFAPLPASAKQPAGAGAFAAVSPVFTLLAKNRKDAADLFGDLRRVVEKTDLGELVERRDGRGRRIDVLRLQGRDHDFQAFVCVHDETVLVTGDEGSLVQACDELRSNKPRGRKLAASTIQAIGGADVAGLFDIDLSPVFRHLGAAIDGVDLSGLPKRHVGYLDIDRNGARSVVRIRVLSSR